MALGSHVQLSWLKSTKPISSGLFPIFAHRISTHCLTFDKAVMRRCCSRSVEHVFMTADSVAHETFPGKSPPVQKAILDSAHRFVTFDSKKALESKASGTLRLTIASSGGSSGSRAEEVHKQERLCTAICYKIYPFAAIISCQHCCSATDEILGSSEAKADAIQSC